MPHTYLDNYYGSILDPLHGDIKLSEIEKWVISQPIFSRLRRVKQNTFLYYVFPSANHTRFEHSIGVMHLASRIFESCKENYATGIKKLEKYKKSTASIFFDLTDSLMDREELFYQELRLAALLHDVGHGPLSHLFDDFSISKETFLKIIKQEAIYSNYYVGFEQLIGDSKNVEHEIISCSFIIKLIHDLKEIHYSNKHKFSKASGDLINQIDAKRIVKLIEPKFPGLPEVMYGDFNYTPFASRIITSFPIDADRMDYLLRDSYFSGVTYGIYDLNRTFASFMAVYDKNLKAVNLIFKDSGLDSVLRFIQSRSHLFNQVYSHKTNRAANTMLTYGTTISYGQKLINSNSVDELIQFYTLNSDEFFLRKTVRDELAKKYEKNVIDELIDRRLFKRVYELKLVTVPSEETRKANKTDEFLKGKREKLNALKKVINKKLTELSSKDIFAVADVFHNVTFKDLNKSVLIAMRNIKGEYEASSDWKSINKEFELTDICTSMIRVYIRRNFRSSDEFDLQRRAVLELIQPEIEQLNTIMS